VKDQQSLKLATDSHKSTKVLLKTMIPKKGHGAWCVSRQAMRTLQSRHTDQAMADVQALVDAAEEKAREVKEQAMADVQDLVDAAAEKAREAKEAHELLQLKGDGAMKKSRQEIEQATTRAVAAESALSTYKSSESSVSNTAFNGIKEISKDLVAVLHQQATIATQQGNNAGTSYSLEELKSMKGLFN
jgi:hypothetical protein